MSVGVDHVAARLIEEIRRTSGLSQAELARRTGLDRSVLSAYEHGRRQPSVGALARIATAAGLDLRLAPAVDSAASEHAGMVLSRVLDLADSMPYRPRRELAYPPLIRLAT
jgi:transcriptional regulator with XRE-family HTH domain